MVAPRVSPGIREAQLKSAIHTPAASRVSTRSGSDGIIHSSDALIGIEMERVLSFQIEFRVVMDAAQAGASSSLLTLAHSPFTIKTREADALEGFIAEQLDFG